MYIEYIFYLIQITPLSILLLLLLLCVNTSFCLFEKWIIELITEERNNIKYLIITLESIIMFRISSKEPEEEL